MQLKEFSVNWLYGINLIRIWFKEIFQIFFCWLEGLLSVLNHNNFKSFELSQSVRKIELFFLFFTLKSKKKNGWESIIIFIKCRFIKIEAFTKCFTKLQAHTLSDLDRKFQKSKKWWCEERRSEFWNGEEWELRWNNDKYIFLHTLCMVESHWMTWKNDWENFLKDIYFTTISESQISYTRWRRRQRYEEEGEENVDDILVLGFVHKFIQNSWLNFSFEFPIAIFEFIMMKSLHNTQDTISEKKATHSTLASENRKILNLTKPRVHHNLIKDSLSNSHSDFEGWNDGENDESHRKMGWMSVCVVFWILFFHHFDEFSRLKLLNKSSYHRHNVDVVVVFASTS